MATLRTVLNRTLVAMGESQIGSTVTTITDSYQLLLLEFVNQFKEEIEDAWEWRAGRILFSETIPGGSNNVVLSNSNARSRILRVPSPQSDNFVPLVFDVTTPSTPWPLQEMSLGELLFRYQMDGTMTFSQPLAFFATDSDSSTDKLTLYAYPTPNASNARNVKGYIYVPQTELLTTDLDTEIMIPYRPLLLGTIWYAREERGEEIGPQGAFTEERFRNVLDGAIDRDRTEAGDPLQLVVD